MNVNVATRITFLNVLAIAFFAAALCLAIFGIFAFLYGFPLDFFQGTPLRFKGMRKIFEWLFISLALGVSLHPRRREILSASGQRMQRIAQSPVAIWILTGVYFLIFLWQQITKYLALEINFVPFLFYDYMLWYFDQAKFCYTGFLHGFYHINLILLSLYPVWKIFQSTWVLHIAQPLIAAFSAVPLFFLTRNWTNDSLAGWVGAFAYLNFRFLQNVLLANFVVEIFYPLFIFSAVYFAFQRKTAFYLFSVLLGLLVKEDSVIYFGGLGLFLVFWPGQRLRGLLTVGLSIVYALFILKIFIPWSGSTILKGDLGNYKELGSSPLDIAAGALKNPLLFVQELFIPTEKLETLFKLTSRLLFLPLLSPWFLMVLLAVYPLFFRSIPGQQFVELALYYSAPVLPFLFIALADGWKRTGAWGLFRKPALYWTAVTLVIFLNGLNLRPLHFTRDDLKTISLAKTLPQESIVVTQGHLLPYLGYRHWNFYVAKHYGRNPHTSQAYLHPDYYLFDLQANPYPLSVEQLKEKVVELKEDPLFEIRHDDGRRILLERRK